MLLLPLTPEQATPEGISALTCLSELHLDDNLFADVSGLEPLRALPVLKAFSLPYCELPCLPQPLSALTALNSLNFEGNPEMDLNYGSLRQLLQRMPCLTRLDLSQSTSARIDGAQWISLGRSFPKLKLVLHEDGEEE